MTAVADLVRLGRATARRIEAEPASWVAWLPPQMGFFACQAKFRLLRSGNQSIGKSTALLADLVWHAMGTHPWRASGRARAGEYWLICSSWSQSVAIQEKLHALIPPGALHPDTVFSSVRGFKGKNPAVQVRHALGGWSTIRIKTAKQGSLNLAGATIDGAAFDEIPLEGIYAEVVKRVQARGGWISLGLTPIGAPVDWLRELAVAKVIEDLHSPLTPEALIPVGRTLPRRLPDGTPCDAEWIAKIERETPAHEVPVRIHGEWEVRSVEAYFAAVFRGSGPTAHVHDRLPKGDVTLALGIDHGSRPGKQTAILVAVDEQRAGPVSIYVLDQWVDLTGVSTPEEDARGILAMLQRHGLQWRDLKHVHGDRVHLPGSGRQKSNKDLAVQIAKVLRIPPDALLPQIRTVKRGEGRGAGSKTVGLRWVYHTMSREGGFGAHPRCARLIEGFGRYNLTDDDHGWSDSMDALRYALDPYIFATHRSATVVPLRLA